MQHILLTTRTHTWLHCLCTVLCSWAFVGTGMWFMCDPRKEKAVGVEGRAGWVGLGVSLSGIVPFFLCCRLYLGTAQHAILSLNFL